MKTASALVLSTGLLALAVLPGPSRGSAQTIPSPYRFLETRHEAGLFVGQARPGAGRFGYGPKEGLNWGARYGFNISGPFGIEGTAGLLSTRRELIDPGREEGDRTVGEVESRLLTADARLRFSLTGDRTWHGLSPFLFTGGGVVFDVAGEDAREELLLVNDRFRFRTSFLGSFGGGVRWFPTRRLLLRADLSLALWRLKTPLGFRDSARGFTGVGEKEWVSGPSFTLGSAFRF